jgi:hypothetical protein
LAVAHRADPFPAARGQTGFYTHYTMQANVCARPLTFS